MRALYGTAKLVAFLFLAGVVATRRAEFPIIDRLFVEPVFLLAGWLCVYLTLVLTVARGLPVVVDAWPYLGWTQEEFARDRRSG
jgi:CDP-diacylglycerol--glycerol-3-phosphate 3-phosphatidyltransferase